MKKYYATQVDSENFNYADYYNEDDAREDLFTAYGGRDFMFNFDLWKDTLKLLEDIAYDDDRIEMDDSYDRETDKEQDRYQNAEQSMRNFLCSQDILTAKGLSDKFTLDTIWKFIALAHDYCNGKTDSDAETVAQALSIIYSRNFKYGEMRGYCQGDWCEYVCPEDMSNRVDYIEAVLFGTGTEYAITTEPVEADDVNDAEVYYDYTYLYRVEDIRNWVAGNLGCDPAQVVIRNIKNTFTTKHYEYEEN